MKAYSMDLRERVVATADEGKLPRRSIAERFMVSYSWLKKLLRRRRQSGDVAALPHGGGQKPRLEEPQLQVLREVVAAKPDATLEELCRKVKAPKGPPVSRATMCRTLKRLGLSRKKKGTQSQRTR